MRARVRALRSASVARSLRKAASGTMKMEVSIVDEDGRRLARVESPLEVGKNPELPPGWRQGLLSVLNFANLKFDRFGTYSFELVVDNFSLKSVLLRVAQRPKIPARD